jgi:hypothetical protein
MAIYTVYIDLGDGASPDDYVAFKRLMLLEFKVSPITPIGQIPVHFSPLSSPLPPVPLRKHIERRIRESMRSDDPIAEVIEMKPFVVE